MFCSQQGPLLITTRTTRLCHTELLLYRYFVYTAMLVLSARHSVDIFHQSSIHQGTGFASLAYCIKYPGRK